MAKVKVTAGFSGVIATGSYENARPAYSAEVEVDVEKIDLDEVRRLQVDLQEICYQNFKRDEQRQIIDRIAKERADFRWYNDGQYPSVTSVIGWDSDFFVPPHELQQYASQGNLYHRQAQHFIETGEWLEPEKIQGTFTDLVIVKQGSLGLIWGDWDFPAFLKKYPFKGMEVGHAIVSHKHKFGGTPDIRKCEHDGKKTLADLKRTPDKFKHFKQLAAYILAEEESGEAPYEQMAIIPANGKTEQGFSKPILSSEIAQFKEAFLRDREAFKKRFGV